MKKDKSYRAAHFSAETLSEAIELFWNRSDSKGKLDDISVTVDDERWTHEDLNDFLADYRKSTANKFSIQIFKSPFSLFIGGYSYETNVTVAAPSRGVIQEIFSLFERDYEKSIIEVAPAIKRPAIFIGHGRSSAWRDLKDHLQDKHKFEIITYETGARAGHAIRDILNQMADESSMALLVYTAEDEQKDGTYHARQNVIHETGLFQGKLGFSRAITLLENGVEPFSNLQGIEQIRFSTIKETFGDVLATIKREFEEG